MKLLVLENSRPRAPQKIDRSDWICVRLCSLSGYVYGYISLSGYVYGYTEWICSVLAQQVFLWVIDDPLAWAV